jgi:hypothetical protein
LSVAVSSTQGPPVRGPWPPGAMHPPQPHCHVVSCLDLKNGRPTGHSRSTLCRLLPRWTSCTLAGIPSMRACATRRLPGRLAPSTCEPHRGDAVPPSRHLRASRQPSSTSSSPHRAFVDLASCHITRSPES